MRRDMVSVAVLTASLFLAGCSTLRQTPTIDQANQENIMPDENLNAPVAHRAALPEKVDGTPVYPDDFAELIRRYDPGLVLPKSDPGRVSHLALGDFNGDGLEDAAVVFPDQNRLLVIHGMEGGMLKIFGAKQLLPDKEWKERMRAYGSLFPDITLADAKKGDTIAYIVLGAESGLYGHFPDIETLKAYYPGFEFTSTPEDARWRYELKNDAFFTPGVGVSDYYVWDGEKYAVLHAM